MLRLPTNIICVQTITFFSWHRPKDIIGNILITNLKPPRFGIDAAWRRTGNRGTSFPKHMERTRTLMLMAPQQISACYVREKVNKSATSRAVSCRGNVSRTYIISSSFVKNG